MLEINPERDENGDVVAHDNQQIENASLVIRRVSHHQIKKYPDGNPVLDENGNPTLTTLLMRPSTRGNKGMSVDLEALILSDNLDPREYVSSPNYLGAVSLTAGEFRNEELQVGYDPTPENIYHGEVWGNFPRGRQKRLLLKAQWYVKISSRS